MKTLFKILVALSAAAGVFFTAKHIIDAINHDEDTRKHIAMLKSKLQVPTRAKNRASDKIIKDNLSDLSFDMDDDMGDFEVDVVVVEPEEKEEVAPVLPGFDEEDDAELSEELLEHLLDDDD